MDAYGFRTDTRTRPLVLSNYRRVAAETPECIRSRWLLEQMLVFQYDRDGKPQAVEGEHDDLVLCAAICHMARTQQETEIAEEPQPVREKLIKQWERGKTRRVR